MALTEVPIELSSAPGIVDNSTGTAITIDASGNVGIGTASPEALLSLSKTTAGGEGGYIYIDNPATSTLNSKSGIKFGTSSGASFASIPTGEITNVVTDAGSGASALTFGTFNGTASGERMRIDSSGNVGIGTDSPSSYFSPELVVHSSSNLGGITIRSNATTDTNYLLFADGTSGNERYRGYVGYDHNADTMNLATGASPAITIDSSGNVGIGLTSPAATFGKSGSLDANGIVVSRGQLNDNQTDALVMDYGNNLGSFRSYGATAGTGEIAFRVGGGGGSADSEAMRIDASGNVGIGTDSPATKLHVISSVGDDSARFSDNANYTLAVRRIPSATGVLLTGTVNSALALGTDDAERMRIDASGNLLVGTDTVLTGNKHCFVDSSLDTTVAIQENGGAGALPLAIWNTATTGDNLFVKFFTEAGATTRGSIDYNRTGVQVRYNVTSDQRLKENIVDAPSASDDIDAIQVRSFDWIENGHHQSYGLIAQELLTVVPDAVRQPEDPEEMMGVDYSKLVPMMLKEIQSLRARVAQLEGAN